MTQPHFSKVQNHSKQKCQQSAQHLLMDFEEKLIKYRAKQRREDLIKRTNEKVKSIVSYSLGKMTELVLPEVLPINELEEKVELQSQSDESDTEPCCDVVSDSNLMGRWSPIRILTYVLYAILWGTLYAIFIKLEFGLVFLVVSALVGMYLNTRTTPKAKGEVSAYSVFNKDCKSIDGALNADQFDREIRGGGRALVH